MIYIPHICGTCKGSRKAIDTVYNLYEQEKKKKNPKKIVIYKEILHNKCLIDDLHEKGIECVDTLDKVDKDTIVIIRAHGEGEETYNYLRKQGIEYYDCTCQNVLRIHDIIREKYYQKYEIVIIGEKKANNSYHPEVEGSNGWCQNNAKVISNVQEVDNLELQKQDILIICQTTFNENDVLLIADKIKEKYHDKHIEFINTTCSSPKLTQEYSLEVAKKCDYMIIIGGKNSHNSNELYKLCNEVVPSVKVSNLGELFEWLKKTNINEKTNIGITGGASTQEKQLQECKNFIEFYNFYTKEKLIIEKEIEKYNKSLLIKNNNKTIEEALHKFTNVNTGGKYLRAILISLGYRIFSKKEDLEYIPLAIAYEIFQTAILIHDDIIDDSDKRRGIDTIHTSYRKTFSCLNKEISNNIAKSLSICIGDLGFYLANQIIVQNYSRNPNLCKIMEYYNKIVIETIKGEIIDVKLPYDLQYENVKKCDELDIIELYKLKTAMYTTIGPFCLGCLLSGNNKIDLSKFESIFKNIGIAFQIKDDIIGIYGDANYIGKPTNSDISEFKQTILYSYVFNKQEKYLSTLHKYYGKKDLSIDEINCVKQIFIDSGALEYANKKMHELFDDSIDKVKDLNIDDKYKNIILGFISYLKVREK